MVNIQLPKIGVEVYKTKRGTISIHEAMYKDATCYAIVHNDKHNATLCI